MGDMHFLFGDFHFSRVLYILISLRYLESEIGHTLHEKNEIKVALYSGFYHLKNQNISEAEITSHSVISLLGYITTVRDVTWMSDQSLHSAKWRPALGQVTVSHLGKCPHKLTT